MEVITKAQLVELELNEELISLKTGEYLEDTNNINFKEIKNQVFPGLKNNQIKLLNTGCGGAETIVGTYTSYVGKPQTEYGLNTKNSVSDYISINKICLGIDIVNNKPIIKNYSAKDHIKDGNKDYIFTFYRKKKSNGYSIGIIPEQEYYVLKQIFEGGTCINELFLLDNKDKTKGIKKPLSFLKETTHLKDILNTNYSKIFFSFIDEGNSILQRSKKLIYAMDRKIASFEKEFLQYTEQLRIFNGIKFSVEELKNQKIDWSKKNYVNESGEKASVDIVKNSNNLLETSIEYNKKEFERLSGISFVPKHFFGQEDNNGTQSGSAMIKRSGNFYKKVQEIRDIIEELYVEIIEELKGEGIINWESIITYGTEEKLDEAEKGLNLGLLSKRKAMKKVYNLSDKEIEKELDYINKENTNDGKNLSK